MYYFHTFWKIIIVLSVIFWKEECTYIVRIYKGRNDQIISIYVAYAAMIENLEYATRSVLVYGASSPLFIVFEYAIFFDTSEIIGVISCRIRVSNDETKNDRPQNHLLFISWHSRGLVHKEHIMDDKNEKKDICFKQKIHNKSGGDNCWISYVGVFVSWYE